MQTTPYINGQQVREWLSSSCQWRSNMHTRTLALAKSHTLAHVQTHTPSAVCVCVPRRRAIHVNSVKSCKGILCAPSHFQPEPYPLHTTQWVRICVCVHAGVQPLPALCVISPLSIGTLCKDRVSGDMILHASGGKSRRTCSESASIPRARPAS